MNSVKTQKDLTTAISKANESIIELTSKFEDGKTALEYDNKSISELTEKFEKYNQGVDFGSKVIAASIPSMTAMAKIAFYLSNENVHLAPIAISVGAGYLASYFFFQAYARTYKEEIFGSKVLFDFSKYALKMHKKDKKEHTKRYQEITASLEGMRAYRDYLVESQNKEYSSVIATDGSEVILGKKNRV